MDYTYRLFTNKTIGVFKNKDEAISLLHHIPNSQIEVFQNLIPIGIYTKQYNDIYFNKNKIELDGFMQTWFNDNSTKSQDNELNVFIPVNTNDSEPANVDMEKYLENIKLLEENARLNEEYLHKMKDNISLKQEEFKHKKDKFIKDKRIFDKEKEEWIQFKTKLEADKRVYFIIKEQLESGELTEESIPVLFQDKYPIFKQLDDNKLIDNNDILTSNDIVNYLNVLPSFELKQPDINLDSIFSSSDPLYLLKKYDTEVSTD
jgi:hypothetical protein